MTPTEGPTIVSILDPVITLKAGNPFNILGRAIVVHAQGDDLGLGGDSGSQSTGNAGARVACGVIKLASLPCEYSFFK